MAQEERDYYLVSATFVQELPRSRINTLIHWPISVTKDHRLTAGEVNQAIRQRNPLLGHECIGITLVQVRREIYQRYLDKTAARTEEGPEGEQMTVFSAL
jgi:hypothetical protein